MSDGAAVRRGGGRLPFELVEIRALEQDDLSAAGDLDERAGWHDAVDSDPGAFAAMVERARAARARGDGSWLPAEGHFLPLEEDIALSKAWWVAVDADDRVLGMMGMQEPNRRGSLPTKLAKELGWHGDGDAIGNWCGCV